MLQSYAKKNNNYSYNRDRSRSCLQSIVFYFIKKSSISNLKSTYLQNASIVVVTIRLKQFKLFDVEYFYLRLSKKSYSIDNYIIFEKNVFYCNIYMFTQQVRRVATTKKINKQLYFCLRKSVII